MTHFKRVMPSPSGNQRYLDARMLHLIRRRNLAHFLRMYTDRKPTRSEEELPKCV